MQLRLSLQRVDEDPEPFTEASGTEIIEPGPPPGRRHEAFDVEWKQSRSHRTKDAVGEPDGAWNVQVADIEREAADESANSICASGGQAVAYRVDISDAKSVAELADQVRAAFGTCHLVCANAGVMLFGRLDQRSVQDWQWVFSVNVMGTVRRHADGGSRHWRG
jgi:hypothetical protein